MGYTTGYDFACEILLLLQSDLLYNERCPHQIVDSHVLPTILQHYQNKMGHHHINGVCRWLVSNMARYYILPMHPSQGLLALAATWRSMHKS